MPWHTRRDRRPTLVVGSHLAPCLKHGGWDPLKLELQIIGGGLFCFALVFVFTS